MCQVNRLCKIMCQAKIRLCLSDVKDFLYLLVEIFDTEGLIIVLSVNIFALSIKTT